ncbi:phage head-tail connector protein [Jeotgalibacillus proteolyticus]|uniref:Phage head-tail adapter protein n=1 Tax=Jeotgalibacillus proteolyticus TaxID=2082395 RepID=A0A2S5GAN2_9BACL|nr:phage head-tail connector protein [Jeotgalibacillus proteolyticus]PPA70040.1 hypothetical protein C4B60_10620 [Jeotgalibacillus proteolyticus]
MPLLEDIKTIPAFSNGKHDSFLAFMVPALEEWIKEYCNNHFETSPNGETKYPGGAKIFIAKACEHNMTKAGLSGRSMGSVSYSYDLEFPESLKMYLRPYRKLKFVRQR